MNVLIERIQKYLDSIPEDWLGAMYDMGDEPKYVRGFKIQARYRADALRKAISFYTHNAFIQMPYSIHLLVFMRHLGAFDVQYEDSRIVSEILKIINGYIFETLAQTKGDFSNAQEIVETIIETLDWLHVYLDTFLEKMKKAWEKREEEIRQECLSS